MNFIFQKDVQDLLNSFSALFDIRIVFFSPDGSELRAGKSRHTICDYCQLLQQNYGQEQVCRALDALKRNQAVRTGKLQVYRCHAGLTEAVYPVFRYEKLLGFIMIGQFRTSADFPKEVTKIVKRTNELSKIKDKYQHVPILSKDKLPHLITMFSSLVEYINAQHMITANRQSLLDEALLYLRNNIHRPVTLTEIASALNRSPGTITNLLRKHLGESFKQVQIGMKLEMAAEILSKEKGTTVQEAAQRVGYSDQFHFSRLFKKYRGVSPQSFKS